LPAVGLDGTIYIVFSDNHYINNLYAINPDGSLKWKFQLEDDDYNYDSSPVIGSDGTLYFRAHNCVYAFGKSSFPSIFVPEMIYDFGYIPVGDSKELIMQIWNYGGAPLSVNNITSDYDEFVVSPTSFTVPIDSSQNVKITFTPSSIHFWGGRLKVISNDPNRPTINVSLSGSGEALIPGIGVSLKTLSLSFSATDVGSSKALTFNVFNTGGAPLLVTNLVSSSSEFVPTPTTFTIPTNESQDVIVSFVPSSIGDKTASLIITSNDPDKPNVTVSLSGMGTSGDFNLYLQPDSTLSQIPYDIPDVSSWQNTQYIYSFTNPIEWKYPLPGDISGNSYLISLMAGYLGVTSTKLKAEIILLSNKTESLLASKEFTGSAIIPPLLVDLSRQTFTIQGIDPSTAVGDTLILRISFVSGNIGIIAYGEPLGQSYISIPDPSGFPPELPILESPLNGSTDVTTNPTLHWNASTDASSYRLQVSRSITFNPIVFEDSTISLATQQIGSLTNNTIYFWRLMAKNSNGNSSWSAVWSFTTLPDIPQVPSLVSPSNEAIDQPINLLVSWNIAEGAETYELEVSESSGFTTTFVNQTGLNSNNYSIQGLSNNTTYYWRVSATNTIGTSNWSDIWSFTTNAITSIKQISTEIPTELYLGNNYPNPFYLSTSIGYSIPSSGKVTLMVFDILYREIATLVNEEKTAGKYEVKFDGSKLSSGVYFYTLQFGNTVYIKKMLLGK
jgi:hypothetical protein